MGFEYVRAAYGVPAKKGGRVRYTGGQEPQEGTITGAQGGHISIRLDGAAHSLPFHPTWELEYLSTTQGEKTNG